MADITTIAAALGSIKTAADIAKLIKNSGASLDKAEIKLQIAELISALAEAKIEIAGIQSDLLDKDKVIAELNDQLELREKVLWEAPYYWVINDETRDGPFCQRCYDVNQRLIRLQSRTRGGWICNSCNNFYRDKNYAPPQPRRNRGFTL